MNLSPKDKKSLVSKLALFSYFLRIYPRLSEIIAPLRRLAQLQVRFRPTRLHQDAFEAAKSHLLDPNVAAIRTPSSDPADTIILWTDASANSISCLLTQKLYPLKGSSLCCIGHFGAWASWCCAAGVWG